mmetsp:Transcript_1486/g.3037  ORF Transcript_1486/g.3037 Transcript_1486/m.3037 type:complete len:217 (-) Transcript_1486:34-684(-)
MTTGCLVVVAGGLPLGVQQTRPVLGFEPLLQVPVNEHLNIAALGSDGEGRHLLGGGEVAQDEGAEDRGEGAPVADDVASGEAERALVQGAHNRGALTKPSVLEGSTKVGAAISNCEYLPVQISRDQDSEAINLHRHEVASSDVIGLQHGHPFLLLGNRLGAHAQRHARKGPGGRGGEGVDSAQRADKDEEERGSHHVGTRLWFDRVGGWRGSNSSI